MIALTPVPMMNPPEVEAMRLLLAERRPRRVLEWGAGGSTLYWPVEFPDVEWLAIEHDPAYAKALAGRLPANVTLELRDFPDYYQLTPSYGRFDLIIVDGRQRVRCLDAARELLADGGAVVLHDAGRPRYTPARAFYKSVVELVPPTAGKDPRGLWLLTGPTYAQDHASEVTAERGAVYLCWGEPASTEAEASMASLWKQMPGLPVLVVGDAAAADFFKGRANVATHICEVDPFKSASLFGFHAGRVKPLLAHLSPFERTLYVDADTAFKASPAVGFDLLDRWDVVIAEAETRSLALTFPDNRTEAGETAAWLGTPHILYHNSGLIFWRRNAATARLFRMWSEEWQRYRGWDEQVALLRALLHSDALFLNVPYTWNCRGPQESFLVYHRFASRSARKFRGITAVAPSPRGVPMPAARPLVRVEVAPGRFVKAHAGDEEKVLEHFRRTQTARR